MKCSTYHGEVEINYIFVPPKSPSKVLTVVFSGWMYDLPSLGEPAPTQCQASHLLTIGSLGVNYLGISCTYSEFQDVLLTAINRDFKIERTVIGLINQIKKDTGSECVVAIGTSLGGRLALYYGIKYGFHVISGAPGYNFKNECIKMLAGGLTDEDVKFVNSIYPEAMNEAGGGYDKRVFLAWGRGESNYLRADSAPKLMADLKTAGIDFKVELGEWSMHNTMMQRFQKMLKREMSVIMGVPAPENNDDGVLSNTTESALEPFRKLLAKVDDLKETPVNGNIEICYTYADNNASNRLRDFVYGAQGYYWLPGRKEALYIGGADNYWGALLSENPDWVLSFLCQQNMLGFYGSTGNRTALALVDDAVRQFLYQKKSIKQLVRGSTYNRIGSLIKRTHFFINYCVIRDALPSDVKKPLLEETVDSLKSLVSAELLPESGEICFQRVFAVLHAAQFFKNAEEFYGQAYAAMLTVMIALNDYYFDDNGVCIFRQTRMQHTLFPWVRRIFDFMAANGFPETPDFKKLNRKLSKIEEASRHLLRADGWYANLGHSDFVKLTAPTPAPGNFVKPESNLAVLSDELSYITVHSGSNVHADLKHADLLSFTWQYDGKQLVFDAGGGNGGLADYARSAAAHSALLCDDRDYVMPEYFDFTAMDGAVERDAYALIRASHTLIDGVTLKRHTLWLKPNAVIIFDECESEEEHVYSQNFLFPFVTPNDKDKSHVALRLADGFTLTVSQLRPTDDDSGFELKKFTGTTDVNAPEDKLRGSRIVGFARPERLLNLAYEKKGRTARYLTVLEAHSGKEAEKTVSSAEVSDGKLNVSVVNAAGEIVLISEDLFKML